MKRRSVLFCVVLLLLLAGPSIADKNSAVDAPLNAAMLLGGCPGLGMALADLSSQSGNERGSVSTDAVPNSGGKSTSLDRLVLVGDARRVGRGIRLAPPEIWKMGAACTPQQLDVHEGFLASFDFQITSRGGICGGGDGFVFVVQNASARAIYPGDPPGQSYYEIPASVAVDFDTYNQENNEPDVNHISIQTRGTDQNSVNHDYSLGCTTDIPPIADGEVHTAKVEYRPGQMRVYVDNMVKPVLTAKIDLACMLQLDKGKAWLGFMAGHGNAYEADEILKCTIGTAAASPSVRQALFGKTGDVPRLSFRFPVHGFDPPGSGKLGGFGGDWDTESRPKKLHTGVDVNLGATNRPKMSAIGPGVVKYAGPFGTGWSRAVFIEHDTPAGPYVAVYGHIVIDESIGNIPFGGGRTDFFVERGQIIGYIDPSMHGPDGRRRPHLHFGLFAGPFSRFPKNGWGSIPKPDFPSAWVDPRLYVSHKSFDWQVFYDDLIVSQKLDSEALVVDGSWGYKDITCSIKGKTYRGIGYPEPPYANGYAEFEVAGCESFTAHVAIQENSGCQATMKIWVDGTVVWERRMRDGDEAQDVSIALDGKRRLRLERLMEGDGADFLEPTLRRLRASVETLECPVCGKQFLTLRTLSEHVRSESGGDGIPQF
jgi:hypothetical protein